MSVTETESKLRFEIIDHNVTAEYVTYILDAWEGDKDDPATTITRYIGVWRVDALEKEDGEAFDPDFTSDRKGYRRYYGPQPSPEGILWETLEVIKEGEHDAESFRDQVDSLNRKKEGYDYGGKHNTNVNAFQAMWDAVKKIEAGADEPELWETIDRWRNRIANEYER